MVLVVTVDCSWWNWLWVEETSSTIPPCLKPISHVYSINETMDSWKLYMVKKKITLDADSAKAVGTFLMFLHETYTPCLVKEMGGKSDDWMTYLKGLVTSEAFILSIPGILSLLILIVQITRSQCCEGGNYRLLRKKTTTRTPHLMR